MLARVGASTVWATGGVPRESWRFRGIFRFVLPASALLFCWFGVGGALNGVPSVQTAAGSAYATGWSTGIAVSSLLWFVGIAFPKLWVLEFAASAILIGLVFSYVALFVANITVSTALVIILILLPIWRIGDLGFEAWQRGHPPHEVNS